jgi:hypothetical protein
LLPLRAHRILIVTSAHHTRRALAIFRHRLPQYEWSIAAAPDERAYGSDWWRLPRLGQDVVGRAERFLWWDLVGFFINHHFLSGALDYSVLRDAVEQQLTGPASGKKESSGKQTFLQQSAGK